MHGLCHTDPLFLKLSLAERTWMKVLGTNTKKDGKIPGFSLGTTSRSQFVTDRLVATSAPFGARLEKAIGSFSHKRGES